MPEIISCTACGNSLAQGALVCAHCQQLVYAAELDGIAREANAKEAAGQRDDALHLWQKALRLLPGGTKQAEAIRKRIEKLERPKPPEPVSHPWLKGLGPIGAGIVLLLTKGKFILAGLTKLPTLGSMLAFLGVYWAMWGWKFALGFVVGIYIHEMGHVWALHRFGMRAGAPMFIPGFGAFVSLYESPANVGQDARIGLAGPIWGVAAAILFAIPGYITGDGMWLAIARVTAWLNLFNLIPVWQLDGGRGFRALDWTQRISVAILLGLLWAVTRQGMFGLLLAGALWRIFWSKDAPPEGDREVLLQYAALAAICGAMLTAIPDLIPR